MSTGNNEQQSGPAFFLSYARAPESTIAAAAVEPAGHHPTRFFRDLCGHLRELLGCLPGEEPGFMDEAIEGGDLWNDELRQMLGTCRVFVPLLSPRYGRSIWCQREWQAFSRRRVRAVRRDPGGPCSAIVPVIWSPVALEDLPEWTRSVQFFAPKHADDRTAAKHYARDGVYGLLATKNDAYETVAWRIAMRICEVCRGYQVDPRIPAALPGR